MAIGTENVSVLTLIMSSAVISAIVNVAWSALQKRSERKRETEKEAMRIGHVYLELGLQLEGFVRKCNAQLYDIGHGLAMRGAEHDESALQNLPRLSFAFDAEPDWRALPIPFVAKVKALLRRFEETNEWIVAQWDYGADLEDAYELEEERIAFHALEVCKVASEIRTQIGAGDAQLTDLIEHFQSVVVARRKRYEQNSGMLTVIPELQAQFAREFPQLATTKQADV